MTREEIEKAIENDECVWYSSSDKVVKIDLSEKNKYDLKEFCSIFDDNYKITELVINYTFHYLLKYLFKTQTEAEHYLHHANISRTETLPFLTWEEFKEIGQISFIGKDKKEYILKKDIIWSNNKYTLVNCLKIVNETDFTFSKYFDYTEENFYKAYDECVRLFKGE